MAKGYQVANEAAGLPVTAEAAAAAGVATTLAYRVTTIVVALIGALYYFMSRREIERALRDNRSRTSVRDPTRTGNLIPRQLRPVRRRRGVASRLFARLLAGFVPPANR